jgi:hypothetical protein
MKPGDSSAFARPARIAVAVAGMAVTFSIAGPALAADANLGLRMGDGPAQDTVVYWGADLSYSMATRYGYGFDAGFVTALNGDIGASGWTFTGNLGYSRSIGPAFNSSTFSGSALLGYQWVMPSFYFTLAGGVHYINNNETPGGGVTDGDTIGAIVQYGFETTRVNALYVQSYGAASTAYGQLYFHVKGGYKTANLRFGAEFTASDDIGGMPALRYGAFVGDITLAENLNMVISAGYQQELDPTVPDSFYALLGFSMPFSIR